MDYFFFYGTLLDPDVFSTVLLTDQDELFEANLTVKDFCCFKVANEAFPERPVEIEKTPWCNGHSTVSPSI